MLEDMPENMLEDMSEKMIIEMSEKNVRRYVRKGCQKIYQKRIIYQQISRKKCYKKYLYWTVFIEFQVPRCLKIAVTTAILA